MNKINFSIFINLALFTAISFTGLSVSASQNTKGGINCKHISKENRHLTDQHLARILNTRQIRGESKDQREKRQSCATF